MNDPECHDVFAKLSEYLDGDLPDDACDELERHIRGCAPCVEFVESLRKSVKLGRQYQAMEGPPPLSPEAEKILKEAYEKMRAEHSRKDG
jgi:anti-sigma factor RsiW